MTEAKTTKTGGTKVASPKIYQAIAAIQGEVGNIPKNGVGPAAQGAYKFISNDDIIAAVSKLLTKHNVVVRSRTLDYQQAVREIGANRSVALSVVTLETTYISAEDGSEFSVITVGEGADNGDKGARKAYTQASKVANLLTFSIATGEPDPDSIDVQPVSAAPKATPAATKVSAARKDDATEIYNQIRVFLGEHELAGSVANALGSRISGGKPASDWSKDTKVLKEILAALKNGEVE